MNINARGLHFKDLNAQIRAAQARDIVVENCLGQRYIGSGLAGKNVVINGLPPWARIWTAPPLRFTAIRRRPPATR